MIGDDLFHERRKQMLAELPDDCQGCHNHDEIGLIKTPTGLWLCFTCYDRALKALRAKKWAAMKEHQKNLEAVCAWITERTSHVGAP